MALSQLIYVSTAYQEFGDQVLERILDSSIRNNRQAGVTGMLLYSKGSFMQVLEGAPEAVDETFARIELDPRHHGVFVLSKEAVERRDFAGWSMGFRRVTEHDPARHPAFAPFFSNGFDVAQLGIHPGAALELLKRFRDA